MSTHWQHNAACRDIDAPDLFHPKSEIGHYWQDRIAEAKAICAACPVRLACLEQALASPSTHGIWGGTTDSERTALRRRHSKAASRQRLARNAA